MCFKNKNQIAVLLILFYSYNCRDKKKKIPKTTLEESVSDKNDKPINQNINLNQSQKTDSNSNNSQGIIKDLDNKHHIKNNEFKELWNTGRLEKKDHNALKNRYGLHSYEIKEYDVDGLGDCWSLALIPVIITQVMHNNDSYNHFINKLNQFSNFISKANFKLNSQEKQLVNKTKLIFENLRKNKKNLTDKSIETLVSFLRMSISILLLVQMKNEWLGVINNLCIIIPKMGKDLKAKKYNEYTRNNLIKISNDAKKILDELILIEESNSEYSDEKITKIQNLIADTDWITRYLKMSKRIEKDKGWGGPDMYCDEFSKYFNIFIIVLEEESSYYTIEKGEVDRSRKKYELNTDLNKINAKLKIIMKYINTSHYKYLVFTPI